MHLLYFYREQLSKKKKKIMLKKRNNGLPGHNANTNTIGKMPYNNVVWLSDPFIRCFEK